MTFAGRDPTQRFSSRVDNYVKYRPGYPPAILKTLAAECGLSPTCVIADVGSGTGLLTQLFLDSDYHTYGVEPNREMREAAERLLAHYPNFTSIAGTAEATTLEDRSVDLVVAGQAFHWFNPVAARAEFQRILKPGGWAALVWNNRRTIGSPFAEGYEQILQAYGIDYAAIHEKQMDEEAIRAFFGRTPYELRTFDHQQRFDFEGLKGRLLSTSYTPEPGHPQYIPMLEALAALFEAHAVNGQVAFNYDTCLYLGQLASAEPAEAPD